MPKKKAPIGVLYSPVGNEKNIFLAKPDPSHGVYSDMDSVSGDSQDDNISLDAGDGFFFGLITNTLKAKKAISNLVCGSSFGLIDYRMDEDDMHLPPSLKISLEKK
ncbi:hypothetical protein G9A89_008672 [Geosiphon pyriformis]|nr:hypothetical protein G9A89_008672 [Geosiphon pyriformis]